jgi:hypothetical protein
MSMKSIDGRSTIFGNFIESMMEIPREEVEVQDQYVLWELVKLDIEPRIDQQTEIIENEIQLMPKGGVRRSRYVV